MRIGVKVTGDPRVILSKEARLVGEAVAVNVTEATIGLKEGLRDDVRRAGLGNRLANTWRSKTYRNDTPVNTAGFIYSKAAKVVLAHDEGATIRPRGSGRYLALPTAEAKKFRGSDGRRISPANFPAKLGRLRFVARAGKPALLVVDNILVGASGRLKSGTRAINTKGRARVRQSRTTITVVMFVLVRQTKIKKKFDIDTTTNKWSDRMFRKLSRDLAAQE